MSRWIQSFKVMSLFVAVISLGLAVQATDRFVSLTGSNIPPYTNWAGAATSIQPAIDAAVNGETVWVSNGRYVLTTQISITKGITVKGSSGSKGAIVDGGYPVASNRCFYISHASAVVDGLTITNGFASSSLDGGGIYLNGVGAVINCAIINNRTYGGWSGAGYGAGAYLNGGGIVSNCVFNYNLASGYGRGGAVYMTGGSVVGCTVISNTCVDAGGGVDVENGLVSNCRITGNTGGNWGGGGMTLWAGTVRNCLIANNLASLYGGGVWIENGPALVDNCTIVSNRVSSGGGIGGGVYFQYASLNREVRNSVIWGNLKNGVLNNYGGSSTNISYSCTTPLPAGGSGNIPSNPLFLSPATGDYHLSWNSPCIDKGTNQLWMTGIKDLDGAINRIIGTSVDMGTYEAVPDTDFDGIPDWWMVQYFGHPTGQAGDYSLATDDFDGDSYTNLEEFQNGGNPKVQDVGSAYIWTAVEIGWKSLSGTNYQVQFITDLASSNWSNFGSNVVGVGGVMTAFDTTRTNSHKYYRVTIP